MSRQNRVTPFSEIVAVPERGHWMGNRGGCFHDEHGRLRARRWTSRAWLICRLQYKGWHRDVMRPGLYTELFFRDEATALAAGHRPCALCRREDFNGFRDAVAASFGGARPMAPELDRRLHDDRLDGRVQRHFSARLEELPDGAMLALTGAPGTAWLLWRSRLHRWTPGGYVRHDVMPKSAEVDVLTPALTVEALRGGFVPQVDATAG